MRKSISAFVFGLIANIAFLAWGFFFAVLGDIASALGGGSATLVLILSWLCFLGAIAGIIGSAQCFKRARVGGIILAVSTVCGAALLLYVFINSLISSGASGLTLNIFICLVPVGLSIAGTVCAFLAKPMQPNNAQPYGYAPQYAQPNNIQNNVVYGPNGVIQAPPANLVDVACPNCANIEKFDIDKFPRGVDFNYRCQKCGNIFKVKL